MYVQLPEEDAEEGMCGKLQKSLYGTRDAAQNWEAEYSEFMGSLGFQSGKSSPCTFYCEARDVRAVIHGDDFTLLGSRESLDWFKSRIMDKFEIKYKGRMGEREEDIKSVRILNRIVTYTESGVEYESDQRHAEIIITQMGLRERSKGVVTPGIRMPLDESKRDERELGDREASVYRGIVARANYLSQDRSDIKFAVKELSRRMAKPRVKDVMAAKRLARYLLAKPRMICKFHKQPLPDWIEGWTDSDWAGCLDTRKSTSGGVLKWGSHILKTWSSTQNVIALSSGEAEFYALVKAASQSLGMKVMLADMGLGTRINLHSKVKVVTDASAARGMALRRGLGPVRHLEVNQLWVQDKVASGELRIEKVGGKVNIADALTKHVDGKTLLVHISGMSLDAREGRHPEAPETAGDGVVEVIDWGIGDTGADE